MNTVKMQKLKLLKIWELLNRSTDADHPLSTQDLINELLSIGISCDRRTIYTDIQTLKSGGYEIQNRRKGHNMVYWVENRQFDLPEIKAIMDAVQCSKFITKDKTNDLLDKIASLGGSCRSELLKRESVRFSNAKHTNEEIYSNISSIEVALESHKRISFHYYDLDYNGKRVFRHDNQLYEEEPIALLCDDGNYYLLCYRPEEQYENHVKIFRVDKMIQVTVQDATITKNAERILNKSSRFPVQAFKMYGGKIRKVKLVFDKSLLGVIFNKFGEDTTIKPYNDKYCATVEVQISPTFWGWMLQFPTSMSIVSPEEVKLSYLEWIQSALKSNS